MVVHKQQQWDADSVSFINPALTFIRLSEVIQITALTRSTIYRMMDNGTFPRAVPLSDSKARGAPVGWVLAEVQAWVLNRIAVRDNQN